MQALIINILLGFVVVLALGLLIWSLNPSSNMTKKQLKVLWRIFLAAAMLLILELIPASFFAPLDNVFEGLSFIVVLILYLIDYLIIGYDILLKAFKGIKNGQVFDECFLMAVATLGALALALYDRSGDYTEAIAVMLFYQIGEWFQSYAVGKSRRNISELMDIRKYRLTARSLRVNQL